MDWMRIIMVAGIFCAGMLFIVKHVSAIVHKGRLSVIAKIAGCGISCLVLGVMVAYFFIVN